MSSETRPEISGTLVLSSPEATKLYEHLVADGILMEFISGLLEERAKGVAQADLTSIKQGVDELNKKVDAIAASLPAMLQQASSREITGVGGGFVPSAPAVNTGVGAGSSKPAEVAKSSVSLSKMKGRGSEILKRNKRFEGDK